MPGSTRRLGVLGCLLLAVGVPAFAALPEHVELETIGIVTVPAGATAGGVLIRDLSGLAYDRATDRFLAVNDTNGGGQARIFELNLAYTTNAVAGITPLGTAQLRLPNGGLLPSVDAEGLALSQRGRLFVSTEGLGSASQADSRDPWVWEFDRATLRRTAAHPVPSHFLPRDDAGNAVAPGAGAQASGVRQNLGFEALTLSPGENYVFVANEAALLQDDSRGPFDGEFNQAHNSDSRILRFARDASGQWQPGPEKVYRADAGTVFFLVRRFNTVPSILAIDDNGRMLVMERGLTANNLNTGSYRIRIYEVDFNEPETTDVSSFPSLLQIPAVVNFRRLSKRLVWQSSSGMDNVEGMTWGRDVDGFRSLVLVSDDNSSANQVTQFIVLRSNVPAPVRIDVGMDGPGSVSIRPDLTWHLPGAPVSVRAEPARGKAFLGWSDPDLGLEPEVTIIPAPGENMHLTARFGSPFQGWLRIHYSEADIAALNLEDPRAETSGDGWPNLLKFALGLPPDQTVVNPVTPVGRSGFAWPGGLSFRLPHPAPPGVAYLLESSENLVEWITHDLASYPLLESKIEGAWNEVTAGAPPPGDGPRQFLRLRVRLND